MTLLRLLALPPALLRWWRRDWFLRPTPRTPERGDGWSPNLDVVRDGCYLVFRGKIPDITRLEVSVERGALVLRGERKSGGHGQEAQLHPSEGPAGSFCRRFPLPEGITPEATRVCYRDGLLEVRLLWPKAAGPTADSSVAWR